MRLIVNLQKQMVQSVQLTLLESQVRALHDTYFSEQNLGISATFLND